MVNFKSVLLWRSQTMDWIDRVSQFNPGLTWKINPCAVWLWRWIFLFIYNSSIISKAYIINSTVYNFLSTNLTAALEKQNIEHHRFITSVLRLFLAEFKNIDPQGGFFESIRHWLDRHGQVDLQWDCSFRIVRLRRCQTQSIDVWTG